MWSALPLQPPKPCPPNAISTTKPPPRRHSMAAHNIQNREEMGGLGQAVITALKSNEPQHQKAAKSKTETKSPPPAEKQELEEQQQLRQLSGADVLTALQRATAQKAKRKKEKRVTATGSKSRNNAARENQGTPYFSNVRPLCILPEWSNRLEELERILEELAHR
ncbi:hypothetical protein Pfo_001019 [Paulownia fortunei]|nr:hypothetical protein Pfo_001019 [Paulownia fortunei]